MEIKFRGLSYSSGWVYGSYIHSKRFAGCSNEHRIFNQDTGLESDVVGESVGQFVGLHDKNGKEIYSGDIIKVGENLICEIIFIGNNVEDYGDEIHSAFHAKVHRHDKIIPLDSYLKNNCVLIGNLYENKDLINQ